MKIFLDSANLDEVRQAVDAGLIDGMTTNPSLLAKQDGDSREILGQICEIVDGPVSAEVVAVDTDGMLEQGFELAKIADNVVVKVPLIEDGLKACQKLREGGVKVNVTLCFSATQALLAAKEDATFISPFVGRIDDISGDGMDLIQQVRRIYDNYDFDTEILAASIRHPRHVVESAMVGADVATMPMAVLNKLMHHPLTDKGLDKFLSDWSDIPREDRMF